MTKVKNDNGFVSTTGIPSVKIIKYMYNIFIKIYTYFKEK